MGHQTDVDNDTRTIHPFSMQNQVPFPDMLAAQQMASYFQQGYQQVERNSSGGPSAFNGTILAGGIHMNEYTDAIRYFTNKAYHGQLHFGQPEHVFNNGFPTNSSIHNLQ
ncbi:uncharacterized protein LOC110709172 [Chenopodium quinoa]|uniref:uncharacterized protein LOC110709172 n=1 Tax=Chenopodium quinoa TaxID=63459 RepID=UPI000B77430A|nr:uncharacterized protein LOC110709172 [Chenopodium quinoa]